ncbi:MAG: hypothetical protein HFH65_09645 [Lachnospiraceae bacterium]|nr:hypothetical protein [Lachnospiraceae bacterium]
MGEKFNDLEMAKKRDHKIIITDEAIAKVPYIRYQEIPEKEYSILQGFAKEILIISKEQNNSNEVALTYSLESEDLLGENLELCQAAEWILKQETIQEKNNRISKELMKKYTPLILHRQTENILQETE